MAWNQQGFFPASYQPYQMPQAPQMMAPQMPQTRTVEVVPVANEDAVTSFPVPVGATVEFVSQDDSFVAFKSNGVNGQGSVVFYDKRPPSPPAPAFDPSAYVTREELENRLAAISAPKRAAKKEEAAE